MDVKTPKSLAMEHEELLKELEAGFVGGGKVAEAARRLMEMIRPHFARQKRSLYCRHCRCCPLSLQVI